MGGRRKEGGGRERERETRAPQATCSGRIRKVRHGYVQTHTHAHTHTYIHTYIPGRFHTDKQT